MVVKIIIDVSEVQELSQKLRRAPTWLTVEVQEALNIGAKLIEADAKADAPVKTGFMRSTIYVVCKATWHFIVGAWCYYARYQEYGTRYIQARRFIQNAIKRRWPQIRDLIRRAVKLALKEFQE